MCKFYEVSRRDPTPDKYTIKDDSMAGSSASIAIEPVIEELKL